MLSFGREQTTRLVFFFLIIFLNEFYWSLELIYTLKRNHDQFISNNTRKPTIVISSNTKKANNIVHFQQHEEANNIDQTKKIHSSCFGESYNKYQSKNKVNVQSCINIQDLFLHQRKKVANSKITTIFIIFQHSKCKKVANFTSKI